MHTQNFIPAILLLSRGMTYGLHKNGNKIYRCVTADREFPTLLAPYKPLKSTFSKKLSNMYVVLQRPESPDATTTTLIETIGSVDDVRNFNEFQLRKSGQYAQGNFKELNRRIPDYVWPQQVHKSPVIFSIDPLGCKDIDDAMSIDPTTGHISVYIADVQAVISQIDSWSVLTNRTSSVYLPKMRKHSMLPPELSENICSLRADTRPRHVFVMTFNPVDPTDCTFGVTTATIAHNFSYDSPVLQQLSEFRRIMSVVPTHIKDSHQLVEWLMITMNVAVATRMAAHSRGIFRVTPLTIFSESAQPFTQNAAIEDAQIMDKMRMFGLTASEYAADRPLAHAGLGLPAYAQITSPIRRLPDILNLIIFTHLEKLRPNVDKTALDFYESWSVGERIEFINETMKQTRKIQMECRVLDIVTQNAAVLREPHDAFWIGTTNRVWIPAFDIVVRVATDRDSTMPQKTRVQLYLFEDESLLTKKVRCSIVPTPLLPSLTTSAEDVAASPTQTA